ncbi:MAG: aldehyde ferredoxin oxidoreductase N-terminal domain-containing protein [Myxococcales bacterium]
MTLPNAYAGKILRVDLSSGRTETFDTESHAKRFLGGRGVATSIHWSEVPPEARFDDEQNRLVVSFGPLCGMANGLGGSRWGIYSKSPFPASGPTGRDHFCYGNLGGSFGAELRFAGYDGLVVQGRSDQPVWLSIEDGKVELHSADGVWGQGTVEAMAELKKRAAPGSKAMAIGPAGEHCVPLATVFADGDASCSGGMGAVMGAKKLKAVVVRGTTTRKVPVADPAKLKEIDAHIRGLGRGNVKVWGMDFMAHGPRTQKMPCYACMGHCLRVRYTPANGDAGKFMCQSRFFYMHHAWGHYGEENDVAFYANRLCDRFGIDTWEVQGLIEWLLLCHAAGVLTERQTGLDLSKVGSLEFIESLIKMTSLRQGFGELLALGAHGAAKKTGGRAEELFTRTDPYDPRYCTVNTLLVPFETREPIQQLHEAGLVLSQWSSWAKGVAEAHISSDVVKGIAERFWGSAEAADMTTLDGKAEAARRIQHRQLAKESMGVCDWMFPLIDVPKGPDHVGDPSFESRILSAVLGETWTEPDLYKLGERVFNLQRAALLREGFKAREHDRLPDEWHQKPAQTHVADPDMLAPGPGGRSSRSWAGWLTPRTSSGSSTTTTRAAAGTYRPGCRAWSSSSRSISPTSPATCASAAWWSRRRAASALSSGWSTPSAVSASAGAARPRRRVPRRGRARACAATSSRAILETEQQKFGLESIRHNFAGWNKQMQYTFPDIGEHWLLTFVDGQAQKPVKLEAPLPKPDIGYEMDTWVLKSMSAGELSGEKAYLTRLLRIKASFGDMLKLQSLNKK